MRTSRVLGFTLPAIMIGMAGAFAQEEAPQQASSVATVQKSRRIEPRADAALKQMSDRLAELKRFAFEAEETFDEIPDGQPRVALSNLRHVALERPNRVATDATGDTLNRAFWYDGETATVLDKAHNTFARFELPDTVDEALDAMADRYGVVPPLADLLYADVYDVLTEGVTYGRYLGIHRAAGVPCHHLVFAQETIEWQIWIDAGADPLPRKFVITYVQEPGEPQYAATITKWSVAPELPSELFDFEAPAGAREVELAQFVEDADEGER